MIDFRAATSTDFCNRLTGPPNSNCIRLTERFASPYGALCFHMFMGRDSPPGPSRLSLQVFSLLVSNQTSFMQINKSINQSIKSSFVKGAGAHPQNAPCRRRSHALRKAPVRRGRLLSTVLHRRQSKIITCGVLMHKNKSLTWCHSPTVSSRINQVKESCCSHLRNQH